MTSKTTFDGPSPTPGHNLDNRQVLDKMSKDYSLRMVNINSSCNKCRLVERLSQQGLSHFPVVVERTDNDDIEEAGRRFAQDIFPKILH